MFDYKEMRSQTLEQNVKLLRRLVEIQDCIILDEIKFGIDDEVTKTKKEIQVYISHLKAYIHTQVDDI